MSWLTDAIGGWFREQLIDGIISNFTDIFDDVNARVGGIADQVGQTPAGWNINIFNMVRTLSETVVIPIAGMILTFVLCYELIHMVIERNNMADDVLYSGGYSNLKYNKAKVNSFAAK